MVMPSVKYLYAITLLAFILSFMDIVTQVTFDVLFQILLRGVSALFIPDGRYARTEATG